MTKVNFTRGLIGAAVLLVVGLGVARSQAQKAPESDSAAEIKRGRYLVEEVAKCAECHTPRNANGDLAADQWLQGATIWIRPIAPIKNWAEKAPPLAGLPSLSEEEAERVLEKGTGPQGEALRPPMHIYHMSHEDAKAIVAYLESLPPARH